MIIPRGATNIKVEQQRAGSTVISLDKNDDLNDVIKSLPSDAWRLAEAATSRISGAEFYYERSIRSRNNVFSPGPIMEDLVLSIEVLRGHNPGFDIEFYHPENSTENKTARYEWTETASSCSSSCGGGFQIVEYKCSSITTHRKKSEVSMQMCSGPRPDSYKKSCSNLPCPAKWTVGNWSHCSKTCGGGESTRTISCVQRQNNNLVPMSDKKCASSPRPVFTRQCNRKRCPPKWVYGGWSKCSSRCGPGYQTRIQICEVENGSGSKVRTSRSQCPGPRLKTETRPCRGIQCRRKHARHTPSWTTGNWETCSKSCGNGLQRREVTCKYRRCSRRKPPSIQRCNSHSCPVIRASFTSSTCYDKYSSCSKVVSHCDSFNFKKLCCASCHSSPQRPLPHF